MEVLQRDLFFTQISEVRREDRERICGGKAKEERKGTGNGTEVTAFTRKTIPINGNSGGDNVCVCNPAV